MFKSVSAAITTALIAVSLVSGVAPQAAQATTDALSFDCTANFYQASGGDFYHFDTTSLTYSQDTRFANINSFNALGWNPADNHIYGFDGNNKLVKLNNDGTTDGGRTVSGTTPKTTGGTFLSSDRMLTVGNGNFTTVDLSVNPPVGAAFTTTSQGSASWGAADIAYYATGNVGYGLDGTSLDVATFDANDTQATVSTRAVTFADLPSGTATPSGGDAWGAAYVDSDGNGYFFNNNTAGLYVIYAADLAGTANPVTAHWKVTANSLSSPNDGASCPTAAAPAGLAPATTPSPTPAPASYAVNFDSQGGTPFASTTYSSGGCVDVDRYPTRAGYTFIGWFVAPVANTLLTSPYCPGGSGEITLYAHWAPVSYTVNYDPQGGSPVASGTYTSGNSINLAGGPTRGGYTFGGWSLTPAGSTTSSPYTPTGTGNITFYAIWTASSYPVTFNPNGGAPGATGNYTTGGSLPLAPAPSLPGYTFTGWFLAPTGGSALTSPYTPGATGPITLYAQWAPIAYKVAFNTQGGSSVADGSYNTAGCVNLPAAPTREGYTFNGWFAATDGGTALANPYCPTGTGDISVYAQWTKNAPTPVTPAKRPPVTVVISGFADGSPALNKTIKSKIDAMLKKYNDYKFVQCVGFTEGPTVLKTDKALSLARATNSCAYVLGGLGKGLKAKAAKFGNETTEQAQLRRVEITLSDE